VAADHSSIVGGHADGSIFTWELAKTGRPLLHIPPHDPSSLYQSNIDGHGRGAAILHVGFLGARHTAVVSADDRGMAFSHLATRGLGAVARSVRTTRILGRYPDNPKIPSKPRKPSSVLACSPLPLGSAEQITDTMGIVALLTPYLLVIVSTTPIAQTQHKATRPKEVQAHSAMSGCLAWFPSVKLKVKDDAKAASKSQAKLVYCWSNVLTILEVFEEEAPSPSEKDASPSPSLDFRARSRWKAEEAIVAVQWIGRSVIGILTITQQLVIIEDGNMRVTETFDLMQRQISHFDSFSKQLQSLVEKLDEEDDSMHGVVADAFYGSFRTYKGRIFLLGFNDVSMGTLSNWADRLLALMENDDFIGAINLATSYYTGDAEKLTVGLPEDDDFRHSLVQEKLFEMMSASLKFAFTHDQKHEDAMDQDRLQDLADSCFEACINMEACDFLFDEVYEWYENEGASALFLTTLEPRILNGRIRSTPPTLTKNLVALFTSRKWDSRLEEMICHMDTATMDLDQITTLCKKHNLYDALIYVWNQALEDYITPLVELLSLVKYSLGREQTGSRDLDIDDLHVTSALKIFPYLSYVLTGRMYPTGDSISPELALKAKSNLYHFLFSGNTITWPKQGGNPILTMKDGEKEPSFPYLRIILHFDAPSFLSALNEAFEDSFLNGASDRMTNGTEQKSLSEEQVFGLSVNRQYIVSILLEVMNSKEFGVDDTIYLDMFIARNLPKFPQFILLSGTALERVLVGLCQYPSQDIAEDCQLSVEYLLSMYRPPNLDTLLSLFTKASFFRVLKSIYKAEQQYSKMIQTYFDDRENQEAVFDAIGDCLRLGSTLSTRQKEEVESITQEHARDLVEIDIKKIALMIEAYAPDLHPQILDAIEDDHQSQYEYLHNIIEPDSESPETRMTTYTKHQAFTAHYVRLMCRFAPKHVADYISLVQAGNLRLEEVLPAMEESGVIDAAVILMAREGKIRDAMDRLINHLGTLEAALTGFLRGLDESKSDSLVPEEGLDDLLESLRKYALVGVWLCQGQSKTAAKMATQSKQSKRSSIAKREAPLNAEEQLWTDLLITIVRMARSVTESSQAGIDAESHQVKVSTALRNTIQTAFTAVLTSASTNSSNVSFIKVLRAFLVDISSASPSLSDLRIVLNEIFSAYAYEESILGLANRLLDKDLFKHIESARRQRGRGWRPRSQVCEGCGRRVWGPGAGGGIWEAWEKKSTEELQRVLEKRKSMQNSTGNVENLGHGKSREQIQSAESSTQDSIEDARLDKGKKRDGDNSISDSNIKAAKKEEELGSLVIFSCRHVYHLPCLERLNAARGGENPATSQGEDLRCIMEHR
jgi:hypothetical protein